MSLKSLEGLPEEVAALYKKGDDGEYHLETDGLKSALQKERERANAAEKAVKEREAKEAADRAEADRKELERKGEYEKLNAASKAEIERLAKELADEKSARNEAILENAASSALAAAGIPSNRFLVSELKKGLEIMEGVAKAKGDPTKTPANVLEVLKKDPECAGLFPASANGAGTQPPGGGPATGFRARHDELSKKATLTSSESIELVKLAGQIESESKP